MVEKVSVSKPYWWDDVLKDIESGTNPAEALKKRDATLHMVRTWTSWHPSLGEQWNEAKKIGRWAHVTPHLPSIERLVRTGMAPQAAAAKCGLPKHVWSYYLRIHPDKKDFFAKLSSRLPPAREHRQVMHWLLTAIDDEVDRLDPPAPPIFAAVQEIVVHSDVPGYRNFVLTTLAKAFAYRDDVPVAELQLLKEGDTDALGEPAPM